MLVNELGADKFRDMVEKNYLKFANQKLVLSYKDIKEIFSFINLP